MTHSQDNMANVIFVTVTGFPATLLALSLSQADIAMIGIVVNVILALVLKGIDIAVRKRNDKNDR